MFDSLLDAISGSGWTYVVVFAFALLDAVFPVVPSETSVIAAGVLAAAGDLSIALVIAVAACGAIVGDNLAYLIGHRLDEVVHRRLFRGSRRRHLERAERTLAERGGYLIVIARFIPGGRTAVTFSAGILRFPWRRFIAFDSVAGLLWGSYAGLVGYFGGKTFEESPTKGIMLALAIAFGVAAGVEGYRLVRRRRLRGHGGTAAAPEPAGGDGVDGS
ncbi:MAG: DedA family protein [Thermoleophilia bacterium]|nr:DedA family protein [Thermoleophilia bacterium]